ISSLRSKCSDLPALGEVKRSLGLLVQFPRSEVVCGFLSLRFRQLALALRRSMLRAVGLRLRRGFGARFRLARASQVDNLDHRRCYFSIAFLKAGRDVSRAVYSLNTSVSGVILNSIMK